MKFKKLTKEIEKLGSGLTIRDVGGIVMVEYQLGLANFLVGSAFADEQYTMQLLHHNASELLQLTEETRGKVFNLLTEYARTPVNRR